MQWRQPETVPIYVGVMETSSGLRLLQYLEKRGQSAEMLASRGLSAQSFGAGNTIFIGMPRTTGYFAPGESAQDTDQELSEGLAEPDQLDRHSCLTDRTHRSAKACRLGERAGSLRGSIPLPSPASRTILPTT